ncbi:enoyl-CoA hydratase/isomerase family protein [Micromonospora sp. ANENR4]|uniref:enoyl-CoA hydratase-related protein n=1 Tax=unclassified Micromonospora TaxID=2617518 RepID=UPI00188F544B|nr:enoyl-CoA hydratase-related protein [Micromonospora sp. WMMC273]MBF5028776.1 enoyl-CoA hydratase/isomerase family protein [Micromonospora sp. ANENR4]MCZ7476095.1 enoyl-CoA hydratase-related protein [Micromonospora sp. WMMC273]
MEPVGYAVHDAVAVATIDRPQTRNALSADVLRALAAAMDRAEADPEVRVLVLTGGPRLFAAGADIRELRRTSPADYLLSERLECWNRFARFGKPAVAAVAGYVLGGGCELAMTCDAVVAADSAVFGQPEINLGIIPGAGGTQRWARVAGRFRAAELVLGGRLVDAWTAQRMGLVSQVVPAERVVEAGIALAASIAARSPVAARLGKQALRTAEEVGLTAGLAHERSLLLTLLSTDDHIEGIDAFLEKRPARFTGR